MTTPRLIVAAVGLCTLLVSTACSTDGPQPQGSFESNAAISADITGTRGPHGEQPTPLDTLTLTNDDIAKLRAGHHTAALSWHTSSPFVRAVQRGAEDEFARLGIETVAATDANFDAGAQANQIQTIMAKQPDVMLGLPVDPTSGAVAFRPAVEAGVKLVFLSNVPSGYRHGTDYAAIATDDLANMGAQAADRLAESIGHKGKIGMLYYNAEYYVTNQRDAAFKQTIQRRYPNIELVAEQGFADPSEVDRIAGAMLTQHPDLDGIYTSWSQPAQGVLSALRTVGNTKTKLVTLDVDAPVMADMVAGGSTAAVVVDQAYDLGRGMADAAAYALLGKNVPPFLVTGAFTATKQNAVEAYHRSLHQDPPDSVRNAGGQP